MIDDLPEEILAALQNRARAKGRSLKAEVHAILVASVQQTEAVGLSTRLRQRFAGLESDEPMFKRDRTPSKPISFD